jgi:hypothetical protein
MEQRVAPEVPQWRARYGPRSRATRTGSLRVRVTRRRREQMNPRSVLGKGSIAAALGATTLVASSAYANLCHNIGGPRELGRQL